MTQNTLRLGAIADDFTGATDLANTLVRQGMRVVQTIGVPDGHVNVGEADAVVVALKSRTIAPADAVAQSLAALRWLQARGAKQIYQKVCSTFDSTDQGNIGPVAEALMDALGCDFAAVCPAFPENQRTVVKGHLFVGDLLLSDSSMRHHPLTPMTDASLVRVLQRQVKRKVGLIDYRTVMRGPQAIADRIAALRAEGVSLAIVDALSDDDLMTMGRAFADLPLLVAGSGMAMGLPQNHGLVASDQAARLPAPTGRQAVISGSCSQMSNAQVARFLAAGHAGFAIDPLRVSSGVDVVAEALSWAEAQYQTAPAQPVLVYATAEPDAVKAVQAKLGVAAAGELIEHTLSSIARGLVERGVGQLVVAGGETSGACVQALGITQLRIGPQIAPGVPWCHATPALAPQGLHITLKSGNFGQPDFFEHAFGVLAA